MVCFDIGCPMVSWRVIFIIHTSIIPFTLLCSWGFLRFPIHSIRMVCAWKAERNGNLLAGTNLCGAGEVQDGSVGHTIK